MRKVLGERLAGIRGDRTQREFSDAVDQAQQTVSKWEAGQVPETWFFIARLRAMGEDLNKLFDGLQ